MAVEDHPLWSRWKSCLEKLIEAKEALKRARGTPAEQAAVERYNAALADYNEISNEI
ncbi:hypothetical protein GGD63_003761 [Bradyrhizobium sp. cir1]|uniref:hypothetical protein n=1 Tax=Bradyrhizobium sp. cir1 TaxID=1445730 RepID=UPI001605C7F7|nr:hypothetical protein [Bradyrhizobium sp. cir1]MBB4370964.1 hypothetical protein [Bradyrhizobium sp. cir1]